MQARTRFRSDMHEAFSRLLRLAFETETGNSSDILRWAANLADLQLLVEHPKAPAGLSLDRRIRDLSFTAANYGAVDELPFETPDVKASEWK